MKRVTMVINGETIKIENVEEVTVTEYNVYKIISDNEIIHNRCSEELLTTDYIKELLKQNLIIEIEKL